MYVFQVTTLYRHGAKTVNQYQSFDVAFIECMNNHKYGRKSFLKSFRKALTD